KGIDFIIEKTKKYQNYKINGDFDKLEVVDLSQVMEGYQKSFFSGIAFSLTNSSTNFNRTRAAYILDRFLCDNLVPIDVELPDQHSGDAHGSEPSCYACHYRLDPMAGFFKDYGFNFQSFKGKKEITFDDFARMDKEEFDSNWLSNDPAVRKWNIGVVRSEKDETKNYYGEDIVDLFRILKEMPEVKKCMTRRVFEYTTSTGQNVDQEYLDNVYKEFDQISQRNSSHGIKYLFKTFVLNKTFTTQDPEIKKCYDFPTGFDPAGAPPCEVRFILQNKCSNCHFPFGGEGGLDVTTWKKLEGDRFGFVHENGGKQLSVDESFEKMSEALSSSDPKVRMPYKQHMDPSDRETLYLWVNQQLQGAQ
ncbi:MAG: hypothetical protein MJK18_10195, partial [Bdellovibrionales bacterium]|nr:hypothetical protein [Bdellovibrionales bacterium]